MNVCALLGRLSLWICLAGTFGATMAQVYTWTDADGKKHFGDAAMRPKDKATPEVKVPPPNVADRFEARQTPERQVEATSPPEALSSPPPAAPMPTEEARPRSGTERGQDACKAKWEAFDAATACYDVCGKNLAQGGGRNNAACGHCTDVPMPRC